MKFVSCIKWVKRGVATENPEFVKLQANELSQLVDDQSDVDEADASTDQDEYQMAKYDAEDETLRVSVKGVATYRSEKIGGKKKKIKRPYAYDDSDNSEQDDERIQPDDNLVLLGMVDENENTLQVHVYNERDDDFYIHHDLILKNAPLCMEWLSVETEETNGTNLCAIGSTNAVIEVWDVDVVNAVEPVFKLGRMKKIKQPEKNYGHEEAVLCLAWNPHLSHVLASASVDRTVALWDLHTGQVDTKLTKFKDKVQSVRWSKTNSSILTTGCADAHVRQFDCRYYQSSYVRCKLDSGVEVVEYDPQNEHTCYAGTETGHLHMIDFRGSDRKYAPVWSVEAHQAELTSLVIGERLISVSVDDTLKVWDVRMTNENNEPKLIYSSNMKLGNLHCVDVNPDNERILCIGGTSERSSGKNLYKIVNLDKLSHPVPNTCDQVTLPKHEFQIPLLEDAKKCSANSRKDKKFKKHASYKGEKKFRKKRPTKRKT